MSADARESGIHPAHPTITAKRFDELATGELLQLLALRAQVFVVEQACVYLDIDGRDEEPDTLHVWVEIDGRPAAYLRLLHDGEGVGRIGRVVTNPTERGLGLAARLVTSVTNDHRGPLVLDAQSHLVTWYESMGFARSGNEFVEDGIPHVPMRRD